MGLAAIIIPLITQVGIPAAAKLIALWHTQAPDTVGLAEYSALLATLAKTPDDAIRDAAKAAGIASPV